MKIIKFFIRFIVTILVIGFIVFYYVQKDTLNNLKVRKKNVTSLRDKFEQKLDYRDKLVLLFSSTNSDSLKYLIDKSKLVRKNKGNLLEIEFNEYKLNKFMMNKCPGLEKKTISLYGELNEMTNEYNSSVKDYNVYFTIFPHFIFAKRKGFKTIEYLAIEYGKENQDPIEKSKELPEWAKNIDTTFLENKEK